jgi:hypothetical protein
MQTRFSSFLNTRSLYTTLLEPRQTSLSPPSFSPISRLQMNLTQPLTNQPQRPYSRFNASYVAESLSSQQNTRPTYIRQNTASAFSRYEKAIAPAAHQTASQFTYSSSSSYSNTSAYSRQPSSYASNSTYTNSSTYAGSRAYSSSTTMPVHGATPSLVKILAQYKKLPDNKENKDATTKLNFLLALSRSWFLIRNKPLLAGQTDLKKEIDSMLKAVTTGFEEKKINFANRLDNGLIDIFKQLNEILGLMEEHNIHFSEEHLNRFIKDNKLRLTSEVKVPAAAPPPTIPAPTITPVPLQPDTELSSEASANTETAKYPQLDTLMQKYIASYNSTLKKDLVRMPYEVIIDDKNVFSTSSSFAPTLDAFKAVKIKFLKGSDSESSSDEEVARHDAETEIYINTTKKQVLHKIKNACSPEQYELISKFACQNIVTLLLNYQSLLKEEKLENQTPIKNLCGLECGNTICSQINIHCDTHAQAVTLNVSFNNHSISKDPELAGRVKTILDMMDQLTDEEKDIACHECKVDLSIMIKANGDFTCQDVRITKGKKIIN